MGLVVKDDGWRIPDQVWVRMEPLLPERPGHPLGCHNPRVPDREAMNAILLVLRTGMQWNALSLNPRRSFRFGFDAASAGVAVAPVAVVALAGWLSGRWRCGRGAIGAFSGSGVRPGAAR